MKNENRKPVGAISQEKKNAQTSAYENIDWNEVVKNSIEEINKKSTLILRLELTGESKRSRDENGDYIELRRENVLLKGFQNINKKIEILKKLPYVGRIFDLGDNRYGFEIKIEYYSESISEQRARVLLQRLVGNYLTSKYNLGINLDFEGKTFTKKNSLLVFEKEAELFSVFEGYQAEIFDVHLRNLSEWKYEVGSRRSGMYRLIIYCNYNRPNIYSSYYLTDYVQTMCCDLTDEQQAPLLRYIIKTAKEADEEAQRNRELLPPDLN